MPYAQAKDLTVGCSDPGISDSPMFWGKYPEGTPFLLIYNKEKGS